MFTACLWTSALIDTEPEEEEDPQDQMKKMNTLHVKQLFKDTYPFIKSAIFRLVREESVARRLAEETFIEFYTFRSSKGEIDMNRCRELALQKALRHCWIQFRKTG